MKQRSKHVFQPPNYKLIDPKREDYGLQLWKMEFFCGQELNNKELKKDTVELVQNIWSWPKEEVSRLRSIRDGFFGAPGKYAHAIVNGGTLRADHQQSLENVLRVELSQTIDSVEEEEVVVEKKKTTNIQEAMWSQIETIANELDEAIDKRDWKFDIRRCIVANENAKAPQCRLLASYYLTELDYVNTADPEEYEHYKPRELNSLKMFLSDIVMNCETIIKAKKQSRKPRVPKAPNKEKLVSKLKFQKDFPELGLVSLTPIEILESNIVWYYNTKKGKLGFFSCEDGYVQNAISVKGTSLIAFNTSGEKKVRKPESLKGIQKLSKTKLSKLYKDLTTKETTPSARLTADTIIVKKF